MKNKVYKWKMLFPLLLLSLMLTWKLEGKAATGINVEYHTQDEIKQMYYSLNIQPSLLTEYQTEPVLTAPYSPGVLAQTTVDNAVNTLNFIRYVAGIPYNVQNDAGYQEKAQAAALVNNINRRISHYPEKPANMSEELYALGREGARSSNLGWGHVNLYEDLVSGWMDDSSPGNKTRVGHRRWCLNPSMGKTGFGAVGYHYAMYCFDTSNSSDAYGVIWPAQNTPLELFMYSNLPWNISMGKTVDISTVQVSMKRQRDGRQWNFSQASSQGYFNVNNDRFGMTGCIIFQPEQMGTYQENDSFHVEIKGAYLSGEAFEASYDVNFFWIEKPVIKEKKSSSASRKLAKPKKVKLKRISSKRLKITWKRVPGATKYQVYCKKGKKGKYKKIRTTSKTSYIQKKCKKGKVYSYKIRALKKASSRTIKSSFSAVKKLKY